MKLNKLAKKAVVGMLAFSVAFSSIAPLSASADTENVPINEDIDDYIAREVLPYAPDAWIDKKKTKIGYEIPMTRYFYEYQEPEKVEDIMDRLHSIEADIQASLDALFGGRKI